MIYKYLLPRAKAWSLTANKRLRDFFVGLSFDSVKDFFDGVWGDINPQTTREILAWEKQFGLASAALTEQQRRDRLTAAWRDIGGQDPRYIQDTLQANGFDVYLHEWWTARPAIGSHTCAVPKDPTTYLRSDNLPTTYIAECGELIAACGEATASAGDSIDPVGYPLVNKIMEVGTDIIYLQLCGEELTACGEDLAECGEGTFSLAPKVYTVPTDPEKWPYFLYIGGATFPATANIPTARRDEFEDLCLKICPAQQWLGILVNYT